MKTCSACGERKSKKEFYRKHGRCKTCVKAYQNNRNAQIRSLTVMPKCDTVLPETKRDPMNPKDAKEIAMKRMLSSAKTRAAVKGLQFNLHYEDVSIPNLCPVLRIPLIPSEGILSDNSPSLDRLIPYLGYTKGNVKVISMKANRIKTDATSSEIEAVLTYVKKIEEDNI